MTVRILFLTQNRENLVCLDMFYRLERALGELAECVWAGPGYDLYKNEGLDKTVKRLYGTDSPDWVITSSYLGREGTKWIKSRLPVKRRYKVATIMTDIHRCHTLDRPPTGYVEELNRCGYDAILMLYTKLGAAWLSSGTHWFIKNWIQIERSLYRIGIRRLTSFRMKYVNKVLPPSARRKRPIYISPTYYIDNVESTIFHLIPWITPSLYHPTPGPKENDVVMFANVVPDLYPIRFSVQKNLPKLAEERGWRYIVKGPPRGFSNARRVEYFEDSEYFAGPDYVRALGLSETTIFDTSVFKYPLVRFMEAMACKTLVLSDCPLTWKECHLVPFHNFVGVNKYDWQRQLEYFLTHEDERRAIVKEAYRDVMRLHTTDIRAKQLYDFLEENK